MVGRHLVAIDVDSDLLIPAAMQLDLRDATSLRELILEYVLRLHIGICHAVLAHDGELQHRLGVHVALDDHRRFRLVGQFFADGLDLLARVDGRLVRVGVKV